MPIKVQGTEVVTNDRKLINLDGAGVSGIVTSLVAGTGINISGATGQVTISSSVGFTSVSNVSYDLNNNGDTNVSDATRFAEGYILPSTTVSIANTTNTAGIQFWAGDILKEAAGLTQSSGAFSIFTRNSTYNYAENYINATSSWGMIFGAPEFGFRITNEDGNGAPQEAISIKSSGNLNFILGNNVKIQAGAGCSITTGSNNVFIGNYAGKENTVGLDNIFMGASAGRCNTTQSNSIAIGQEAGYWNRGDNNIYLGECAGKSPTRTECTTGTHNVSIGQSAGANVTTGSDNIFIGCRAGFGNTSGFNNNFFGNSAGYSNENGFNNSFFGNFAGYSNKNGNNNSFVGNTAGLLNEGGRYNNYFGSSAGSGNIAGYFNNFIGYRAGCRNRGTSNIFIGSYAGHDNICGNSNIAIGSNAGYCNEGDNNIYLGPYAGHSPTRTECTTGTHNVSIGQSAGANITTGCDNIFIGCQAGFGNTCGFYNNFFGHNAGYANTCGFNNNFFGRAAGYSNENGNNNSFFGHSAGYSNESGRYNNYFGASAGYGNIAGYFNNMFGYRAGSSNRGSSNIFIGNYAGYANTYGSNNIAIGSNAGYVTGTTNGLINLTTTGNNIVIGNCSIANFYTKMAATGSGGNAVCWNSSTYELYSASSSARYKENIRPFLSGVKELVDIEPVTFTYIDRPDEPEQIGFIAEQLDEIGLTHFVNYDKDNRPDSVSYDRVIVLAINAIKELNNENQELKLRITQLENVVGISSSGSN